MTSSSRLRSSWPTGARSGPTSTTTPTCSGPCEAPEAAGSDHPVVVRIFGAEQDPGLAAKPDPGHVFAQSEFSPVSLPGELVATLAGPTFEEWLDSTS